IAALGLDRRRFRPNILVAGTSADAERTWPGRRLRIGGAVIDVASLRQRCVMTTYDPDTQAQDVSLFRRIVRERGGRLPLDSRAGWLSATRSRCHDRTRLTAGLLYNPGGMFPDREPLRSPRCGQRPRARS